jgi:hypothetical protein
MSLRTHTLIAVLVLTTTTTSVVAQGCPAIDLADSPSSDSRSLLAPLESAPPDGGFDALVELSGQPDWYSPISHAKQNNGPTAIGAACETSDCKESNTNEWDFSQGLLTCLHEDTGHRFTGFLDFNYYYDTRDFNILTINAGAKLPHDFEYFQFVNFTSQPGNEAGLENWTDFFTEIHLRRPIAKDSEWFKHLDWTVMWADGSRPREVGRLGIRWRFQDTPGQIGNFFRDTLKLRYSLNFHILEDDGSGWQMEHVYRRDFLDGLIYVGGFADHNVNGTADNSDWVSETQVGVKLLGGFYAVAEYRYFSFANSSRFKQGVGIGLEYALRFQ